MNFTRALPNTVFLLALVVSPLAAEDGRSRRPNAQTRPQRSEVEPASFSAPLGTEALSKKVSAGGDKRSNLDGAQRVPLPPRGQSKTAGGTSRATRPVSTASTLTTGVASLAVVLGLFFIVAWALRRAMPRGTALLPGEVVEVLGRTPLAGRQFAHLIRCGNKLLLVHLAPGCAETLTEITDPAEVDRLAGLCKQAQPQSSTASFRQVFQQFSREGAGARRTSSGTLLAGLRDHQQPETAEDADV